MYRISQLAKKVDLSRSTLLYYEKIGVISSKRQANGYRVYTELDVQRLKLLQQLQAGGLTLKECQACWESQIDKDTLQQRLNTLDEEIAQKQKARALLASMLGRNSMRYWHQIVDKQAPEAHLEWLMKQGFSERQALKLKWLSRDMNEHEQYMAGFEQLFDGLMRLGPGTEAHTLRALSAIPIQSGELLEIGCGRGGATTVLAEHSPFVITALDNDADNLSCLIENLSSQQRHENVTTVCGSMTAMPFSPQQFDVIWAEGCAYIMGVEQALKRWKSFIQSNGYLVLSDLVWLTEHPDAAALSFWQQHYPLMSTVSGRRRLMEDLGYRVIDTFPLCQKAWDEYLIPLRRNVQSLIQAGVSTKALDDIQQELAIHQQYLGQYSYQIFVLQRIEKKNVCYR